MLQNIKINLNVLELINFFWQSVMDGEKVGESYLSEIANSPEMSVLYDNEFNSESVRKVLSAITNRELLNTQVQREKQFWNNNMWVTEDREMLNSMIQPIKTLNLNSIKDTINKQADIPYETIEIVFIPALKQDSFQKDNQIFINFFKIMVDIFGGTGEVTIDTKSPADFVIEKILGIVNH